MVTVMWPSRARAPSERKISHRNRAVFTPEDGGMRCDAGPQCRRVGIIRSRVASCWPRRVALICELAAREGHAGGKEDGSVSQVSFGRFIASASRSVPVLEKQRPPRPALRAGDAAKGAWSPASPPAAEVYMRPAEASEMVMSKHWLRRLHTPLVALALAFVPLGTGVNA